jgi:hypothetical protein
MRPHDAEKEGQQVEMQVQSGVFAVVVGKGSIGRWWLGYLAPVASYHD